MITRKPALYPERLTAKSAVMTIVSHPIRELIMFLKV
jgi:hypothetical protein